MLNFNLSILDQTYQYDGGFDYNEEDGDYGSYNDNDNSDSEDRHDGCTGLIAKHNSCDIKKFPGDDLRSRIEFNNVEEGNFCCDHHAYVAKDECEVSIYEIHQDQRLI